MKLILTAILFTVSLVQFQIGNAVPVTTSPSRPLKISELNFYANTSDGNAQLKVEFCTLRHKEQRSPWSASQSPTNLNKNRYDYIIPYDESRVVLESLPGDPQSDYINANYIDGQNSDKEYVATQSPLVPGTVDDFWRMMWKLNSTKIIMLTSFDEDGVHKAEQYWPDLNESVKYGSITVTLTSEKEFKNFGHVVRTFSLKKEGESSSKNVRQFHHVAWPDHTAADTLSVIGLLHQTRKYKPDIEGPIVVHCSAGVGRTGTVILVDSMIQKGKAEGIVDFPARLEHMRDQRVYLVENKLQYIFAHKAVNDFFNRKDTEDYLKLVDEEYKSINE